MNEIERLYQKNNNASFFASAYLQYLAELLKKINWSSLLQVVKSFETKTLNEKTLASTEFNAAVSSFNTYKEYSFIPEEEKHNVKNSLKTVKSEVFQFNILCAESIFLKNERLSKDELTLASTYFRQAHAWAVTPPPKELREKFTKISTALQGEQLSLNLHSFKERIENEESLSEEEFNEESMNYKKIAREVLLYGYSGLGVDQRYLKNQLKELEELLNSKQSSSKRIRR